MTCAPCTRNILPRLLHKSSIFGNTYSTRNVFQDYCTNTIFDPLTATEMLSTVSSPFLSFVSLLNKFYLNCFQKQSICLLQCSKQSKNLKIGLFQGQLNFYMVIIYVMTIESTIIFHSVVAMSPPLVCQNCYRFFLLDLNNL